MMAAIETVVLGEYRSASRPHTMEAMPYKTIMAMKIKDNSPRLQPISWHIGRRNTPKECRAPKNMKIARNETATIHQPQKILGRTFLFAPEATDTFGLPKASLGIKKIVDFPSYQFLRVE
jgi:hypothetical protein